MILATLKMSFLNTRWWLNEKAFTLSKHHSGRGDIQGMIGSIIDYYNKKDFEVTVYITQRRAHATDILLKNKGVYDNVVCCGGDGILTR